MEVWNIPVITLQHAAITGQSDPPAVMASLITNELLQMRPILPVQAVDIASVDIRKLVFRHGTRLPSFWFAANDQVCQARFAFRRPNMIQILVQISAVLAKTRSSRNFSCRNRKYLLLISQRLSA